MKNEELICDILEILEEFRHAKQLMFVYKEVLRRTGDKKQALAALKYVCRMSFEIDLEKRKAS